MTFTQLLPSAKRQIGQMQADVNALNRQVMGAQYRQRYFATAPAQVTGLSWQGELQSDLYRGGTASVSWAKQLAPLFEEQSPAFVTPIVWMAKSQDTVYVLRSGTLVAFCLDQSQQTAGLTSTLGECPDPVGDGSKQNTLGSPTNSGTGTAWELLGEYPSVTVTGSSQDLELTYSSWLINASAQITGFQVSVALLSNGRRDAAIEAMSLVNAGGIIGGTTVTGAAGTPLPALGNNTQVFSFGDEGDKMGWGGAVSDINASFGASIKVQRNAAQQDATVSLVAMSMTIFGSIP